MSRRALVLDGLWHSLCPSFDRLALSRPSCVSRPRKHNFKSSPSHATRIAPIIPRRCYSSQDRGIDASNKPEKKTDYPINTRHETSTSFLESKSESEPHIDHADADDQMHKARNRYTKLPEGYNNKLEAALEGRIRAVTTKDPSIARTTQTLRALIRDRGVEPHTRHYQALIFANCDNELGSPEMVQHLLQEMEENGITADSRTLHAALKVRTRHTF
jgi:hypothetical protein